jgi:hypothetical protein
VDRVPPSRYVVRGNCSHGCHVPSPGCAGIQRTLEQAFGTDRGVMMAAIFLPRLRKDLSPETFVFQRQSRCSNFAIRKRSNKRMEIAAADTGHVPAPADRI